MYGASIDNTGNRQYSASAKGYQFLMGQEGANPIDALLASLCACVGHHFRDHLMENGGAFSRLSVSADADLAADKLSLAHIAVRVHVGGRSLTEPQKHQLLAQAKLCPIYNTLGKCVDIQLGFS